MKVKPEMLWLAVPVVAVVFYVAGTYLFHWW